MVQKLQKALIKGLIPISRLAGRVGDSLGKDPQELVLSPGSLGVYVYLCPSHCVSKS